MKNNYMTPYYILIILVFFFSSCNGGSKIPPNTKKVEDVKEDMKRELIKKNRKSQLSSEYNLNLKKLLRSKRLIIQIVLIVVIVGFVITLLFFLIRKIISDNLSDVKSVHRNTAAQPKNLLFEKKALHRLVSGKKYSQAILLLHYYTIHFLFQTHITYEKNMTNFDLFKKIKSANLASGFKDIYKISERIVFDNYVSTNEDYQFCFRQYNKYFREAAK